MFIMMLTASIQAFSQQDGQDVSIQFSGNLSSQSFAGQSFTTGNIYIKGGYFFTKGLESGLKLTVTMAPGFDSDTGEKSGVDVNLGYGTYVTYSFLFKNARAVPYVGLEYNSLPMGKDSDGLTLYTYNFGGYTGLKLFMTERINFDAGLNVLANVGNSAGLDVESGPAFQFNIGIGVILGRLSED